MVDARIHNNVTNQNDTTTTTELLGYSSIGALHFLMRADESVAVGADVVAVLPDGWAAARHEAARPEDEEAHNDHDDRQNTHRVLWDRHNLLLAVGAQHRRRRARVDSVVAGNHNSGVGGHYGCWLCGDSIGLLRLGILLLDWLSLCLHWLSLGVGHSLSVCRRQRRGLLLNLFG